LNSIITCKPLTNVAVEVKFNSLSWFSMASDKNLDGVIILGRKNRRKRFFLPSKENTFGGWKVGVVMIDNGCNSILLPLAQDDLQKLAKHFHFAQYKWEIASPKRAQGGLLSLKISSKRTPDIPIQLCQDFKVKSTCCVPFLRFHICSEDIEELLALPDLENDLKDCIRNFGSELPAIRRTHALLGQVILDRYTSIQHRGVLAIIDPAKFTEAISWEVIISWDDVVSTVRNEILPDNFEELEDEDHAPDDDEGLEKDDFVDE